uniref:Myb-transcription factor n=1 Tax=Boechera divaricarpa TaxID=115915 RepID=B2BXT1_9BRAS|nr:myb-transcription factor [Boechera divaricarpa]
MDTLDIVQEEGTNSSYVQHTGKFQPKPRLLDTVVEEPELHYSVDDTGYFLMGTNESEFMVNVESRNDFSTYGDLQEKHNIPEVPREMVPEMEARNASGGWEHKEQVVSPCTNNTVTAGEENCLGNTVEEERAGRECKIGNSKRTTAQKRKNTREEPNKSSEKPEKKKFKHSTYRQKRTLEKELLETPDDEIRFLPIRDMLRLVEYKEWMEKKEAKGAGVPPTQESNRNASESQYYSQGFDADEFGVGSSENQETNVVKPDSPVNYQTYMNKTSRTRWSKQDTELFYEGIREFGSNLSMVQLLFPNRTREQMKLKFKLEERRYPSKLNDSLSSRSKHHIHFHNVIKKLQQEGAAAKEAEEERAEEEAGAEADVPENEELEKSEEMERASDGETGVKESDGGDIGNGVRSDGENESDGDDDFWNSYKSDM